MADKIQTLQRFSQVFYESMAEIETFLPREDERMNKQQTMSMVRRFSFLREEAEKVGVRLIVKIAKIITEFLSLGENINDCLNALGQILLDTMRLGMALIMLEAEGRNVPQDYSQMLIDGVRGLFVKFQKDKDVRDFEKSWVLVVDDEESVRVYVEDVLFEKGYLVLGAKDGREAISAVSTGFFDIVFSDINMPYVSGLEFLKYVKDSGIVVDVIIFTGFASAKSVSTAIHSGAYDYIAKPFSGPEEILNAAERALQHRLLERSNAKLLREMKGNNIKLSQYAEGLEEALQSLEEKNNALVRAERMATLGVLVAGLAHEINNPTTFIRGNIQALKKFWDIICQKLVKIKDDEGNEKLKYIINEMPGLLDDMLVGTERVSKITSGLRTFARVDESSDKMEVCIIEDVLDSALTIVANRLKNGVILEKNIEQVPTVYASKQQLVQVFVNILLNALDAVENQKVQLINVRVFANQNGVSIEIVDNGCGMKKDIQDKIFDPFFTTKSVDKGTGLGLSISEGIIAAQGGRLRLVHSDSNGTTFEIFIPSTHCTYGNYYNLPTVLMLAEHSVAFRAFEAGIRATGNCNLVLGMADAESITERLHAVKPDLIILDMKWCAGDRKELISTISDVTDGKVKIVGVVDGRVDIINEKEILELGIDKEVILPCSLGEVLGLLEELLGV